MLISVVSSGPSQKRNNPINAQPRRPQQIRNLKPRNHGKAPSTQVGGRAQKLPVPTLKRNLPQPGHSPAAGLQTLQQNPREEQSGPRQAVQDSCWGWTLAL